MAIGPTENFLWLFEKKVFLKKHDFGTFLGNFFSKALKVRYPGDCKKHLFSTFFNDFLT